MKLVIAEKPSMARAIREVVGREYEVTNAFGHILELAEPDAYLPGDVPVNPKTHRKIWRACDLPIIPDEWMQIPKREARGQLEQIGNLLKKTDLVVHAGDPDREGQLLIDEILEHFRFRGRVSRVWLSALDRTSIEKAFRDLRDNRIFQPLSDAAMARTRADWLVGMNFTRAASLSSGSFYTLGRVQTPTLALVVRRDRSIASFVPRDYFEVLSRIRHERGEFFAKWKPSDSSGPGFDEEGRLVDRHLAESLSGKGTGLGRISRFEKKEQRKPAPLPYSLSALQKAASARYGMSAADVLQTCQSLYEKKVATYPRTDCRYLPEEQHGEAGRILRGLLLSEVVRAKLDSERRHPAWNTGKVTAHHAIIPTGEPARDLTGREQKLYDMIVVRFAALFLPDRRYFSVGISVDLNGETWAASGRQDVEAGWKILYGEEEDEEDADEDLAADLPDVKVADPVEGTAGKVVPKETRPPSRFTDGTLIEAMSGIHKFVSDPEAKKRLRETSGIGTEATRAGILEKLVAQDYILRKGKQILSTEKGRSLVAFLEVALPGLADPVTTARWEDSLSEVANGKRSMDAFVGGIAGLVRTQTQTLLAKGKGQLIAEKRQESPGMSPRASCPVCGGDVPVTRLESRNKKGVFFWICASRDASGQPLHAPLSDRTGKPGKPFGTEAARPRKAVASPRPGPRSRRGGAR